MSRASTSASIRSCLAILLVGLLLLVIVLPFASGPTAAAGTSAVLEGPTVLAKGAKVEYTLSVSGGPGGFPGGGYTYTAKLVGKNLTGSSVTPNSGANASGAFRFNVTAPTAPGTVTLQVDIKSTFGANSEELRRELELTVVTPILFVVTLRNTGPVAANDVEVDFYVDGSFLGSKSSDVPAAGSVVVSYEWAVANLRTGKHVVTAIIDRNGELVEFSTGDNVLTQTFYIEPEQNLAGIILSPLVAVLAVLLTLALLRKPGRRPRGAKPL